MTKIERKGRAVLAALAAVLILAVATPIAVYLQPSLAGADHGFIVLTGSMEPNIRPGDVVLVEEVSIDEVEVGDVVNFHPHPGADKSYTHRVVEITHDRRGTILTTKGDANEQPDPMQVDDEMLVGTVEHKIPALGKAIVAVQGPLTPLVLVVLSILTVGHELSRLLEDAEEPEEPQRFPVVQQPHSFPVVKRR